MDSEEKNPTQPWNLGNHPLVITFSVIVGLCSIAGVLFQYCGAKGPDINKNINGSNAQNQNGANELTPSRSPKPTPMVTPGLIATISPTDTPAISITPTPAQTSSAFSGIWNFNSTWSKVLTNKGAIVEKGGTRNSILELTESGGNISGRQLSHSGASSCSRAGVSGRLDGQDVAMVITYQCCGGAQVRFSGKIDSQNRNLTGSFAPVGVPRGNNCEMPYAGAVAVKQPL